MGFYGHPDRARREDSWKLLSYLHKVSMQPWLCVGDFNEVMDNSEKVGGNPRIEQYLGRFWNVVQECNLGDLGFIGLKYTWSNKRERGMFVKERLDGGLASPEWGALFPNVVIEVEASTCSDYHPLRIRLNQLFHPAQKIFRFEASWNVTEDCKEVIKQAWHKEALDSNPLAAARRKLLSCHEALTLWSQNRRRMEQRSLKGLQKRFALLQQSENPDNLEAISQIKGEINKLLEMEDIRWRQRTKRNWYKQGIGTFNFSILGRIKEDGETTLDLSLIWMEMFGMINKHWESVYLFLSEPFHLFRCL